MKIMLCVLTTHKIQKLKRLIKSIDNLQPASGVEIETVIVVNTLSDEYWKAVNAEGFDYRTIRTESNGKPGKGKNSCNDIFLQSDCDYLSQIDGDDILYPTYIRSLSQHIKHYRGIDVLGCIPTDTISSKDSVAGYCFDISSELSAGVWGISVLPARDDQISGPKRDGEFWDNSFTPTGDFIILQSRKAAEIKIDEHIGISEDQLYSFQYLAEHQKMNLAYYQTMSSDLYIIDRTTEGSMQKIYEQKDFCDRIKDEVSKLVEEDRSCFSELPIIYHNLLLTQYDKENWLTGFYNKCPELFD